MNVKAIFLTASLALGLANAQASLYGQCGGTGYSGATSCVSGAVCTSYNAYYYQCVPGTSTSVAATTTATSTSTLTTVTTTKTTTSTSTSTSTSVSTSVASTTTTSSGSVPTGTKYFITFGDSYSQTGFDPNSTWASASNILGNPPFPGWTTTSGLNWIDFLISEYNTSLTLSYNFAYGGATVNASLVAPFESTVLSMIDQVTEFSNSIASKPSSAPWTSADTLVGVWMGVNDVGNSYWLSNETAVLTATMDSYFGQLQILYDAGVRNFVLLNCPPTDKSPLMLAQGSSVDSELASVIAQFNSLLSSYFATFKASNSGVTGLVVDTQAPFNTALNNPTAYGAANATCYDSDGTTCLWWNNYHPALAIHNLTAQAVASALPGWFI